jgi:lysozyme family protein
MAASNFLACFNETESFEGGYVDNPHDPGGATLKGVTQAVYSAWLREHQRASAPVRGASDADIQAIYRELYWNPVRGDDLFVGLDLVMVDYGWGSGPITAIEHMQGLLDISVDGKFGPETLVAVNARKQAQFINELCAERLAFFQRLPTWRYFGVGWTNRLNACKAKALEMNAAAQTLIA